MSTLPRVVLIGIHGHGRVHLRNIDRLAALGRLELVGAADRFGPDDAGSLLGDAVFDPDWRNLLARLTPDVTVVASPLHLHAPMAIAALRAGSDVLLEKPPALDTDEHDAISAAAAESGRVCQVGFQTLGSDAPRALRRLVDDGVLGEVQGVSAVGRWRRPRSYWTRSPWAGRVVLDGVHVVDGALTNPFAHAFLTALAAITSPADAVVDDLDLDLYRANDIDTHDTGALRARLRGQPSITVAATLCAETPVPPRITVHGTRRSATLSYEEDALTVGSRTERFARHDLLANLLDHRAHGAPLLAPLAATRSFASVIHAVANAAPPRRIDPAWLVDTPDGVTIRGVDDAIEHAARHLLLLREIPAPFARVLPAPPTARLAGG